MFLFVATLEKKKVRMKGQGKRRKVPLKPPDDSVLEYISQEMAPADDGGVFDALETKMKQQQEKEKETEVVVVEDEDTGKEKWREETINETFSLSMLNCHNIPYNHVILYFCWKHLWWTIPMYKDTHTTRIHPITKRPVLTLAELTLRIVSNIDTIKSHVTKEVNSLTFVAEALISLARSGTCLNTFIGEEEAPLEQRKRKRNMLNAVDFEYDESKRVMIGGRLYMYFDDETGRNIDRVLNVKSKFDPELTEKEIYIQNMFKIHKTVVQIMAEAEISGVFL